MASFHFVCSECGARYLEREVELVCPQCAPRQVAGGSIRGVLEVRIDPLPQSWPANSFGSLEDLIAFLPVPSVSSLVRLGVGATPLLPVNRLRRTLGMPRLWLKDDTRNPSGSTKDRASLLVVAKAIEYGHDTVAAASTGNAATALAAVAAAAGIRAVLFVPADAPEAKLVQMLSYGAEVLSIAGSYDEAFELCLQACERFGWYNRNTALNPFTIEGKKTAALEIAATLAPDAPDVVVVPVGDGVILAGLAKGFADLREGGLIRHLPRLIAVQPEGSAAIVKALRADRDDIEPIPGAASVADSLVVQAPRNARLCLSRIRESNGAGVMVSDEAILAAMAELAAYTGVFAEPAAASALAGLREAVRCDLVDREERVVILITGTGLKDIRAASRRVSHPEPIDPELEAVARTIAHRSPDRGPERSG